MSLGSNGVDWLGSLRKIPTWLRGPYFFINCSSSRYFVSSLMQLRNNPKCTKTWVYVPMGWIGCVRCEKSQCDFMARTLVLIAPVHAVLHRVSCSYETIPNAPKHYAMHQNMSLGSNGVDWERSLREIATRHYGTNFCINCTSMTRIASSVM